MAARAGDLLAPLLLVTPRAAKLAPWPFGTLLYDSPSMPCVLRVLERVVLFQRGGYNLFGGTRIGVAALVGDTARQVGKKGLGSWKFLDRPAVMLRGSLLTPQEPQCPPPSGNDKRTSSATR
jgi:hypothetical protein